MSGFDALIKQAEVELEGEERDSVVAGLRRLVDTPLTPDDIARGLQLAELLVARPIVAAARAWEAAKSEQREAGLMLWRAITDDPASLENATAERERLREACTATIEAEDVLVAALGQTEGGGL